MIAAVGNVWEPLEKSQRIIGRDRDAGCDCNIGTSKRDNAAMPPDANSAVDMLKICMVWVADILDGARLCLGVLLKMVSNL